MGTRGRNRIESQILNCTYKNRYAEQVAIELAEKYGFPISPYICAKCNHWHIGKRVSSSFHNIDYRLPNPFITRNKYLIRERLKLEA